MVYMHAADEIVGMGCCNYSKAVNNSACNTVCHVLCKQLFTKIITKVEWFSLLASVQGVLFLFTPSPYYKAYYKNIDLCMHIYKC